MDSVDPVDLVLYAPDQYEGLPYSPWRPELEIDWIVGTRLRTDEPVASVCSQSRRWAPIGRRFISVTHFPYRRMCLRPVDRSSGPSAEPTRRPAREVTE